MTGIEASKRVSGPRVGFGPRSSAYPAASLAVVLVSAACMGKPTPLYPGPPRPLSEVAVLEAHYSASAKIIAIDQRKTRANAFLIEPGVHEVWVYVRGYVYDDLAGAEIRLYCGVRLPLEAGRTYHVRDFHEETVVGAAGTSAQISAQIVDVTTEQTFYASQCVWDKPVFHE